MRSGQVPGAGSAAATSDVHLALRCVGQGGRHFQFQ